MSTLPSRLASPGSVTLTVPPDTRFRDHNGNAAHGYVADKVGGVAALAHLLTYASIWYVPVAPG